MDNTVQSPWTLLLHQAIALRAEWTHFWQGVPLLPSQGAHSFSHSSITVHGATLFTSSSLPWGKKK